MAKYTCPKCQTRTCGLACIRKHKEDTSCSGKADPLQKIEKSKIDETTVRKDYSFVKGMLSEADKVKKTLTGVTYSNPEPKRFYYLRKQAKN